MQRDYMILTAVGSDRPGLVREISGLIHAHGCNIEDSRMAILAGEFALILLYSGAPARVEAARDATARALADTPGFVVAHKSTTPREPGADYLRRKLEVSGSDQPGIVHRVSAAIAQEGVNVASLESELTRAAFSGTPVFNLSAELEVPSSESLDRLRAQLEQVCDELDLSFALEDLPAGAGAV